MNCSHVELDSLHWKTNWVPRDEEEFKRLVEEAIVPDRWVVDGNYGKVRDSLWPRATTVIWLNYSFPTVFGRALRRTIRRAAFRETLYSGNRESFVRSFFTADSILWWVITFFRRRRRDYEHLRKSCQFPDLKWIVFQTPDDAHQFLEAMPLQDNELH
jgi:hypothetical protein